MKISQRERGGVTILDCSGKLTIGAGDVALRDAIRDLLERGETMILLNLREITSMDSSGLGEMVAAKTSAVARGSAVKLLHVEDKVKQVVAMTHLIGVFETFDDELSAIASFSQT
jgi:anti-sigma B factor antagonist